MVNKKKIADKFYDSYSYIMDNTINIYDNLYFRMY